MQAFTEPRLWSQANAFFSTSRSDSLKISKLQSISKSLTPASRTHLATYSTAMGSYLATGT